MSRGAGKIECVVLAAFATAPDTAFSTKELVRLTGAKRPASVIKAAQKHRPFMKSDRHGSPLVFYNPKSAPSHALARMKCSVHYVDKTDEELMCLAEYRAAIHDGGGAAPAGLSYLFVQPKDSSVASVIQAYIDFKVARGGTAAAIRIEDYQPRDDPDDGDALDHAFSVDFERWDSGDDEA